MRRRLILAFVAVFFGGQLALVAWSYVRGDRLFGYQMFAETTFFTARLYRVKADGTRVPARGGAWSAPTGDGRRREFHWLWYVDDFRLDRLERRTRAKIGIEVTLKFFQQALDYVAARIHEDRETRWLELEVEWETARGVQHTTVLKSRERELQ